MVETGLSGPGKPEEKLPKKVSSKKLSLMDRLLSPFGNSPKELRDSEYEEARSEISQSFATIQSFCSKLDSASSDLKSILNSLLLLDRRLNSMWATRDLRLARRLFLSRAIQDVGTAAQRMESLSKLLRAVSSAVRQDVDQEIGLPEPGR